MESRQFGQLVRIVPLILFLVGGAVIGVLIGYMMWNPGAANYSVISQSNMSTRTVKIGQFSVTFTSIIICKAGEDVTTTIEISNLDDDPRYVVVSLSLVRSNGVDSTTISALTGDSYTATIAGYGIANDTLSFTPSSNGYALFDITVRGELAGNIILYVVPST